MKPPWVTIRRSQAGILVSIGLLCGCAALQPQPSPTDAALTLQYADTRHLLDAAKIAYATRKYKLSALDQVAIDEAIKDAELILAEADQLSLETSPDLTTAKTKMLMQRGKNTVAIVKDVVDRNRASIPEDDQVKLKQLDVNLKRLEDYVTLSSQETEQQRANTREMITRGVEVAKILADVLL